jgi:thiamine-monophosphate kinase
MKLSRLGEFGLIEKIRRRTPAGRGVRIGIGDDAASLENRGDSSLITADLLIEGSHFDLRWTSLRDLGHKALAVNLSDIAAMGGIPDYVILSLGIPSHFDSEDIDAFYRGFEELAAEYSVALVGGDTNAAEKLIISVCVIGHSSAKPIERRGAKAGDDIYVTGTLGDSALGLKLLRRVRRNSTRKRQQAITLLARHHRPTPRLAAGALLAKKKLATAMIDVSDGLLQDLGHICRASAIGATIEAERLPLSPAYCAFVGKERSHYALSGGEDYELLFCARRQDRARIEKLSLRAQAAITRIGACVPVDRGIVVVDSSGKAVPMRTEGHDHFKKTRLSV